MSEEDRLKLENELLMTCSKAKAINKYIDELEENVKLSELWCDNRAKIRKLENQRKEFVKWLEDWYQISKKQYDELNEPVRKSFLQIQIDVIKEILSKYKEIIGDVEDE